LETLGLCMDLCRAVPGCVGAWASARHRFHVRQRFHCFHRWFLQETVVFASTGTWVAILTAMGQRKPRSRIAQFKQPFLVGAVTSAALVSGCGSSEEVTNPRAAVCPSVTPEAGALCPETHVGMRCGAPDPCEGDAVICSTMEDGELRWERERVACNPPPPAIEDCPEAAPKEGEPCGRYQVNLACEYEVGGCSLAVTCDGSDWTRVPASCNPPPPPIEECPEEAPKEGDSCEEFDLFLTCRYEGPKGDPCGAQYFSCGKSGEWEEQALSCNPPIPLDDAGWTETGDAGSRDPETGDAGSNAGSNGTGSNDAGSNGTSSRDPETSGAGLLDGGVSSDTPDGG
jgi:hypothetical protein